MSGSPFSDIVYQPGRVARVILNRPEQRNAQSWRLLSEMEAAFGTAIDDDACRVIVLSGAGSSFSGGHDLDSPEQVAQREPFDRQAARYSERAATCARTACDDGPEAVVIRAARAAMEHGQP